MTTQTTPIRPLPISYGEAFKEEYAKLLAGGEGDIHTNMGLRMRMDREVAKKRNVFYQYDYGCFKGGK